MCGRLYVKETPAIHELLKQFNISNSIPELYNIAPTEHIPVIYQAGNEYHIAGMRWWLHPSWSKDEPNQKYASFNARIETVLTTPTFRGAVKRQRGIIPAHAFVEWKTEGKDKQPFFIESVNEPLAIAAIWDIWQEHLLSCSIITQPANDDFSKIHSRMPLSLKGEQIKRWLNPDEDAKSLIDEFNGHSLTLTSRAISNQINNARNKVAPIFL